MLCFLTDKIVWPWQLGTQYFVKIKDDWHMKNDIALRVLGYVEAGSCQFWGFPSKMIKTVQKMPGPDVQ